MSEKDASKSTPSLENPEFAITHADTPEPRLTGEPAKSFKLKLTLPGRNIGGEWLCRASGEALAYRNYCQTGGTILTFTEVPYKGKTYLKSQEGQYLTYERLSSCLYMYDWLQSAAWKIEGKHLICQDNAGFLTWDPTQKWPLASGIFLQVEPQSVNTLTVERVET